MRLDHFRVSRAGWAAVSAVVFLAGCDFLNPTSVTNPNTTTEDLAKATEPTKALLPGLKAQMARAVGSLAILTDVASDNFEIAFTNITGELSDPWQIRPDGGSFNSNGSGIGAYWNLQELRALSDFVIDTIAPDDASATDAQLAEAHFYRGMAFLMQGENFIGVPTAPDQAPTPGAQLLTRAEADFQASLSLGASGDLKSASLGALARTYRDMGDAAKAASFAQQALAADPTFVYVQPFSAGEIENPHYGDDRTLQPLPRLDFLDPKYTSRDAPIPLIKAEEMHLILAEVAMSNGDYTGGAAEIGSAVRIAKDRPMGTTNDTDQRANPDLTIRPRDAGILVRANANEPYRAGLILTRPGNVTVPTISGTSLDADSVAALTDPGEIRHAFWLARQEMFFLEGRRLSDLGVRMPVMQTEIDTSPAINEGDPVTQVQVPSYIPKNTIDDFSPRSPYADPHKGTDLVDHEITIAVDMNRILADQKVSAFGPLP